MALYESRNMMVLGEKNPSIRMEKESKITDADKKEYIHYYCIRKMVNH